MRWTPSNSPRPARLPVLQLLCLLQVAWNSPGGAAPVITVDEKIHQFGVLYVDEQKTVDHRFNLQNAGDEPLVIRDIKTSCGCTHAEISRREIPPGESATLDASLQSRNRQGKEQIRISVYSNDPAQPVLEFGMAGFLIPHWVIEPVSSDERMLLVIPASRTWDFRVTIYRKVADAGEPWRILSATSSHALVSAAPVSESRATERDGYHTTVFVYRATIHSGSKASNHEKADITLTTSDPAYPHLSVSIAWIVEGDLTVRPRSVRVARSRYFSGGDDSQANRTKPGNRVLLSSRSKTPFRIVDAKADPPFGVKWDTGIQAASAELRVLVLGEQAAKPRGTLKVLTDRPGEEVFEVDLHGEVQSQGPILSTASPSFHVGTLFADEAQKVTQVFALKNLGTRDLSLSPGETHGATPSLSAATLPPGASATLTLEGDFRNRLGRVELWARINSNDPSSATPAFRLSGEILPRWRLSPARVDFGSVRPGSEEIRTTKITQFFPSWASPVELVPSTSGRGESRLTLGRMLKVYHPVGYGTAETEVTLHLSPPGKPGRYQAEIPLQTKEPVQWEPPSIGIEWEVLGDIRFRPTTLLLERDEGGQEKPASLRIYSKEGREFHVKGVRAPEGIVVQEVEKKPVEVLYQVTATRCPLSGERLVFSLDREDLPEVSVNLQSSTAASSN